MLPLLMASLSIVKPYDSLYNIDLSGDKQLVYVGRRPRPLRIRVIEERRDSTGRPIRIFKSNYPVRVYFITPSKTLMTTLKTDSLGYAVYQPPALNYEGPYRVIFSADGTISDFTGSVRNRWFLLFAILQMLGGFVLFLYGMEKLNQGINRFAGATIKKMLANLSNNPLGAFLVGIIATAAIQSSTAVTVMLVSFVDSGIVNLPAALAIALGSGVGSTITAQIIAFGLFDLAFVLIIIGYLMKRSSGIYRAYGNAIFGIGLLFFSIKVMAEAGRSLSELPQFIQLMERMSADPAFGISMSTIFTAMVHSSAAVVGLAISLAYEHLIDLKGGLYIVFGANIGTSITALLASTRSGTSGKRIALANFTYKVITFIILFAVFPVFVEIVKHLGGSLPRQIANAHTLYNLFGAILFLPFVNPISRFFEKIIGRKPQEKPFIFEDTDNISISMAIVQSQIIQMANVAERMLSRIPELFARRDTSLIFELEKEDNIIDEMRKDLIMYLVKLHRNESIEEESERINAFSKIIDQFESIGDIISKNLARAAAKLHYEGLAFSEEGLEDINELHREVMYTFQLVKSGLITGDEKSISECLERREQVVNLMDELIQKHFQRLERQVEESILTSAIHVEVLQNLERIHFHLTEICRYLKQG